MIGGRDIVIRTATGADSLALVIQAARQFWPNAVVEDAETGDRLGEVAARARSDRQELLIYKDKTCAEKWDALGADESLVGTMIHVLSAPGQITLVIDATPSSEVDSLVSSVRYAMKSRPAAISASAHTRSPTESP